MDTKIPLGETNCAFDKNEKEIFHAVPQNANQQTTPAISQFTAPSVETKVYKRRWIMLAIFVLVSMTNAFQWIQFSIITSLIEQ